MSSLIRITLAQTEQPGRLVVEAGRGIPLQNHRDLSTVPPRSPVPVKTPSPRTVFSGIQPTGIPHLGNYLGAIQSWINLQSSPPPSPPPTSSYGSNETRVLFSIVGLHAITLPQDPVKLVKERRDCLACLLACGLGEGVGDVASVGNMGKGKGKATLFFQEDVPEHAELAWYLNTLTSVGRLERMTTWKSKLVIARSGNASEGSTSDREREELKLGLLAYPVLQTADVLLYKATDIPVGEDQQQHLELARDIAETFNHRFGRTFPLPQHMITPSKRILSLSDPTQKMSKSAPNPLSRILITDSPSEIKKKIKRAVTDTERDISYDPEGRRGVANLLAILAACEGKAKEGHEGKELSAEEVAARLKAEGVNGHAALKDLVAEAVISKLAGIRENYERIRADEAYLSEVARRGRDEAREIAGRTMEEVRKAVGLSAI